MVAVLAQRACGSPAQEPIVRACMEIEGDGLSAEELMAMKKELDQELGAVG